MRKGYKHSRCMYIFGCDNSQYDGGFGFCPRHYSTYYARVRRGTATWDEIKKRTLFHQELTEKGREYLRCGTNNLVAYTPAEYIKVLTPPNNIV